MGLWLRKAFVLHAEIQVSPEAELLKKELLSVRSIKTITKAGKGLTEKRAGSMACGPKLFSVLTFLVLFVSRGDYIRVRPRPLKTYFKGIF